MIWLAPALAWVESDHFTVLGLKSGQRANEVTMRDNGCGVDTFTLEKLGKPVRSFLQGFMGFNGESSVVFFSVMPPAIIQMIKIQMRVISGKFMRRAPDIATVAKLLSHRGIDLKRQPVSKDQMGRLQRSGERRDNDVYKIKLFDFAPGLLSLGFPERCDRCIEYHGIRLVWIVNRVEGRLSVSNKVNCHLGYFRMLRSVDLLFRYLANLCHSQPQLHRESLVRAAGLPFFGALADQRSRAASPL